MWRIELDAEAGQISAELVRQGIASDTHVHVLVEIAEREEVPMTALAQIGGAFGFLSQEPDLYSDEDIARPSS